MNKLFSALIGLCMCWCAGAFPALAQPIYNPDDDQENITENTPSGGYANGTFANQPALPIATSNEIDAAQADLVKKSLQRKAEEAIYAYRGVTMDFLNKPVDLFKLTCTTSASGTAAGKLNASFTFTKDIWKSFCTRPGSFKPGKSGVAQAAKCILEAFLQQQFQGATSTLDKFKSQTFCQAFTDFANKQLNQCIKIRFDLPRGQFPGFPALNQCLFGSLGITVGSNGVLINKSGGKVPNVISSHSYKYKSVGPNSPNGFGGSEQQLLGDQGASGLLDISQWKQDDQLNNLTTMPSVQAACTKLDPDLVKLLQEYPVPNNLIIPWVPSVIGVKKTAGGGQAAVIANWTATYNKTGSYYEYFLSPGADFSSVDLDNKPYTISNAGTWSTKAGYDYNASCYGLERDTDDTTCMDKNSESYKQMCANRPTDIGCCDPDATDCIKVGLVYGEDLCKTQPPVGTACPVFEHLAGQAKACAKTCCNPNLNDCVAMGVSICEKYVDKSQCVMATPDQLKQFDPIYSQIKVKPDTSVGGKACCTTEWCNLCPQDIFAAFKGYSTWNGGKNNTIIIPSGVIPNPPKGCYSGNTGNTSIIAGTNKLVFASQEFIQGKIDACGNSGIANLGIFTGKAIVSAVKAAYGTVNGNFSAAEDYLKQADDTLSQRDAYVYGKGPITCGDFPEGLWDLPSFPMPITKLPNVEGQDPIGLCSELDLCPAGVTAAENPATLPAGTVIPPVQTDVCSNGTGNVVLCTGAPDEVPLQVRVDETNGGNTTGTTTSPGAGSGTGNNNNDNGNIPTTVPTTELPPDTTPNTPYVPTTPAVPTTPGTVTTTPGTVTTTTPETTTPGTTKPVTLPGIVTTQPIDTPTTSPVGVPTSGGGTCLDAMGFSIQCGG